jgi:archaellum component FlaC
LRLFGEKPKKKVLFVLRDFDSRSNNGDKIKQRITSDISEICKKIHKPEALINTVAENFFDFEFALLPHKIYEPQKFNEQVKELRKRFDRSAENSLFLPDSNSKDIPLDGLPTFIRLIWSEI